MNNEKKQEESDPKKELNKHQEVGLELYKKLIQTFPQTNLDRISVIVDLLKIEMRGLSFTKIPLDKLEELGPKVIGEIMEGLNKIWSEDQVHRDQRKEKKDENPN